MMAEWISALREIIDYIELYFRGTASYAILRDGASLCTYPPPKAESEQGRQKYVGIQSIENAGNRCSETLVSMNKDITRHSPSDRTGFFFIFG